MSDSTTSALPTQGSASPTDRPASTATALPPPEPDRASTPGAPPSVSFGRVAPGIPVRDIERALAFYRDALGLDVTFTNGDPVGFVVLERDRAELHLTLAPRHTAGTHNVAHLIVSDASAVHDRLVAAGARIVKGLRDHDFGLRAFVVADPDGNRLDIAEEL